MTSQHLSQALPHLLLLGSLELRYCDALDSLSFLAECAGLSQSLRTFGLTGCKSPSLHSTELKRVLALKALTTLQIDSSFAEPLDEFAQDLFTPPSVVPTLALFTYERD